MHSTCASTASDRPPTAGSATHNWAGRAWRSRKDVQVCSAHARHLTGRPLQVCMVVHNHALRCGAKHCAKHTQAQCSVQARGGTHTHTCIATITHLLSNMQYMQNKHAHVHLLARVFRCMPLDVCSQVHSRAHVRTSMQPRMQHVHKHAHTHTHTYACTDMHATHAHAHTSRNVCRQGPEHGRHGGGGFPAHRRL